MYSIWSAKHFNQILINAIHIAFPELRLLNIVI